MNKDQLVNILANHWSELAENEWGLTDSGKNSLRVFLNHLHPQDIVDAMEIAYHKIPKNDKDHIEQRFRYFCGVCWRAIKGDITNRPTNVRLGRGEDE